MKILLSLSFLMCISLSGFAQVPPIPDPCPELVSHWWNHHLPVGTWIALLALLGVIVPWLFRPFEGMKKPEKALWTAIAFILLGLELATLFIDRHEHDTEQGLANCRQLEEFKRIGAEIEKAVDTSNEQFKATNGKVDVVSEKTEGIAGQTAESRLAITGGNSYLYARPLPINTKGLMFVIHNNGNAPLTSTLVQVREVTQDCDSWNTECSLQTWAGNYAPVSPGTIAGGTEVASMLFLPPGPDGTKHYVISFTAQNGTSFQELWLRDSNDGKRTAYRYKVRQTLANKRSHIVLTKDWTEPEPDPSR